MFSALPGVYISTRDPNVGPEYCTASVLATEQAHKTLFLKSSFFSFILVSGLAYS